MTPEILLYAIINGPCQGSGCVKIPMEMQRQTGLLLYSDLNDCKKAAAQEMQMTIIGSDGKSLNAHFETYCAHIYFADYAQVEGLIYGRVTCSYTTTMPESVMARLLDPYYTHPECAKKAPK